MTAFTQRNATLYSVCQKWVTFWKLKRTGDNNLTLADAGKEEIDLREIWGKQDDI